MEKHFNFAKLKETLLLFAVNFLFTFSAALLLRSVLKFPLDVLTIGATIFTALALLSLLFYNSYTTLGTLLIALLSALALTLTPLKNGLFSLFSSGIGADHPGITGISSIFKLFLEEGMSFFNRSLSASETHAYGLIVILLLLFISLLSFIFLQKLKSYWFALLVLILLIPLTFRFAQGLSFIWLLPLAVASFFMILLSSGHLLALLKKKSGNRQILAASSQLLIALTLAIAVATIGSGLLDYKQLYSSYWQGVVDDLVTLLPQSLQPKLSISPFNLGDDGYYPLGTRLGGPAKLKNDKVALVSGTVPPLIKVQASDNYDGLRWQRLVNNPNFRYASPFNGGSEIKVFNGHLDQYFLKDLGNRVNLSPAVLNAAIEKNYNYSLTPLRQGTQLVFVSGTPTSLLSSRDEALLFYFNQASAIYARTSFDTKHSYKVEGFYIDSSALSLGLMQEKTGLNAEALSKAAEAFNAAKLTLPNEENAQKNYLQLPNTSFYQKGGSVFDLAHNLTDNLSGSYQKVQALLNYLSSNPDFSYSLDVETPPEDRDFVDFFLESKCGYCTYYASAMTVLSRLIGIPARFVEGYALTGDNQSQLKATGKSNLQASNAHAWTEVYLDGLGWVAVDPTPGGVGGTNNTPQPQESTTTTTTTVSEETKTTTTPEKNNQSSNSTPTSSEAPSIEPSLSQPPKDKINQESWQFLLRLLLILFIMTLIAFASFVYYKKRRDHIEKTHQASYLAAKLKNPLAIANFYWQQFEQIIAILNGHTLVTAALTEKQVANVFFEMNLLDNPPLDWPNLSSIVAEARYRHERLSDEKLAELALAYELAEKQLKEKLGEAAYIRKRILPPQQASLR